MTLFRSVICVCRAVAGYFQALIQNGAEATAAANWLTTDLFRLMNSEEIEREAIDRIPITAKAFAGLLALVHEGAINQSTARRQVLPAMWKTGKDARAIVDEKGLAQVSDSSLIGEKVDKVLSANADMAQRYLDGNDKVINAIFGRIMGELRGKGDPAVVRKILQDRLESLKE